ncbi:Glutathione S-transferase domain protein [Moritella sp. JT01]|uniref:glutathione S-transferase n=1 Tax=Moritella sp. JT01 TaxID=756698 RepID=UPI00079B422E|nr:glutathione S-transferase [Moritella sp. JT01]KXO09478.1 Glutathione S-transferase domain protein [Moritella sp. JT01]
MSLPILYSLQNCPYAMRARLGLLLAQQPVMLRAVVMKNKPTEMLAVSPKATVPVLVLDDGTVIDESLDIMIWALHQSDPLNLLHSEDPEAYSAMLALINIHDTVFTSALSKYKYAVRYHEDNEAELRNQCADYVTMLELRLSQHAYLMGENASLADYAILPLIRQFARVDRQWYLQAPLPHLRNWLNQHLQDQRFAKAMAKYPQWLENKEAFLFGHAD